MLNAQFFTPIDTKPASTGPATVPILQPVTGNTNGHTIRSSLNDLWSNQLQKPLPLKHAWKNFQDNQTAVGML